MNETAIIIGAGPAGLTAAFELATKTKIHPIVLELESSAGGLCRTASFQGNRFDLGGHRFFTENADVQNLWEKLMPIQGAPALDELRLGLAMHGIIGGPDPEKSENVFLKRRRVSRIFFLRHFFDYPIAPSLSVFFNLGFSRTVACAFGWLFSILFKRKENSLEDFYINRFGKPLYRLFFEGYTEKVWGVPPAQISAEWGAERVKGISVASLLRFVLFKPFRFAARQERSLIEEFLYPKKGPGQFWELMAEEVVRLGGEIQYESEVVGLNRSGHKIESVLVRNRKTGKHRTLAADRVISTMPIRELIQALKPNPPDEIRRIADELPYRDFITVGLLLNKLKIQNRTKLKTLGNIVPDCWIYIQERDVRIGRLQIFNNWSPYLVKDPEKTIWIGLEYFCREGDELWNQSDREFIDFAASELEKIGIIERADLLDGTIVRVKKAYPAYFGSYQEINRIFEFLDDLKNLNCIGRNGRHQYNNMDQSMLDAINLVRKTKSTQSDSANKKASANPNNSENGAEPKIPE